MVIVTTITDNRGIDSWSFSCSFFHAMAMPRVRLNTMSLPRCDLPAQLWRVLSRTVPGLCVGGTAAGGATAMDGSRG